MKTYLEKCSNIQEAVKRYTDADVMIAFSGGVDSTLLLKLVCMAAKKKNHKVYAVTMHTKLHPMGDVEIAKQVAKEVGAIHKIIYIDELKDAGILENPVERCYLCKKYLFASLQDLAKELSVPFILEGTNADDLQVYRPGIKALRELGIISPLADADFTKAEVRKLAAEYGLSVASRPSTPCLATRFPYGTVLSYEAMQQVEKAEEYIRNLELYNVRVRIHGNIVRLEIDEDAMEKFMQCRKDIVSYLKELGYTYVTLDLEGFRSGSMDVEILQ